MKKSLKWYGYKELAAVFILIAYEYFIMYGHSWIIVNFFNSAKIIFFIREYVTDYDFIVVLTTLLLFGITMFSCFIFFFAPFILDIKYFDHKQKKGR